MEKYTKAQMEVIEFENEDVITASSCQGTDVTINPFQPGGSYSGTAECRTDNS